MNSLSQVIINPSRELAGVLKAPPSKAYTHRSLIATALSEGCSTIFNPLSSDDTEATLGAVQAYGAHVERAEDVWKVTGRSEPVAPGNIVDCRESGATIRFMTPVSALARGISILTGRSQLLRRPIGPLLHSMRGLGITCYTARGGGYPPVIVFGGRIHGGRTSLRGDVSSQFVSGLLFAAPGAQNDVVIRLTTNLESRQYVDMTLNVLNLHGIEVETSFDLREYHVKKRQEYKPTNHVIPGDYSSAAFILAGAAITGSRITIENLAREPFQGDQAILQILSSMGANINVSEDSITVDGGQLSGLEIEVDQIPDLVPVITVLGCYAKGRTIIRKAGRLRIKESNRLSTLESELGKMNASIHVTDDTLIVDGSSMVKGAVIDPHGDHRIAMACSIAALGAEGSTTITDAECVNKSYPRFYEDLEMIGVKIVGG
jgi:3-phosphoshikimate 1-carboxyvinyltransferase